MMMSVEGCCICYVLLFCTLCGGLYIGEAARPVRLRFAEHCRDAQTLVTRSPWCGLTITLNIESWSKYRTLRLSIRRGFSGVLTSSKVIGSDTYSVTTAYSKEGHRVGVGVGVVVGVGMGMGVCVGMGMGVCVCANGIIITT